MKPSRAWARRNRDNPYAMADREALARVGLTLPSPALRVVSGPASGFPAAPGGPSRAWLPRWFPDCPPARTKSGVERPLSRIM